MYTPEIREKPVAVSGNAEARHGIILTKNTIAKQYGVKTGEAIWQAKEKCPDLVCVPPDFPLYVRFSGKMRRIYEQYSSRVEAFGLDESWIDLTNQGISFEDHAGHLGQGYGLPEQGRQDDRQAPHAQRAVCRTGSRKL